MSDLVIRNGFNDFNEILLQKAKGSSESSRMRLFLDWCSSSERTWMSANVVADYKEYLLRSGKSDRSVNSILSTVRSKMSSLASDPNFIRYLMNARPAEEDMATREAYVSMTLRLIAAEADPRNSPAPYTTKQDHADEERQWFNHLTLREIVSYYGVGKERREALRDQAIIALFLTTGIRRAELRNLIEEDTRMHYQGYPALRVRHGKGDKQRLVPYGDLHWSVGEFLLPWVQEMNITRDQSPFRGFTRSHSLRKTPLNIASINKIVSGIELPNEQGFMVQPHPHDLRRTYARYCYENGMRSEMIQLNMGHVKLEITMGYIGNADASHRLPKIQDSF